jgi:LacI family transcriptional regulator
VVVKLDISLNTPDRAGSRVEYRLICFSEVARTTIKDVAEDIGVSVATVSRALNGEKHVRPATRRQVERAARRLGYQPNGLARALRRERTMLVALIVPDVRSEFFADVTAVLQGALEPHGFRLILGVHHDDPEVDRSYLQEMVQQRVDAIIHVPCTDEGAGFLTQMKGGTPIVELNRRSTNPDADTVVADDREGVAMITRHLIGLGHTRIAIVVGRPEASTARERTAGYLDAMHEAGLADCTTVMAGEYSVRWGREAARTLLEAPEPPSAIIAASTQLTSGALESAASLGLAIPDEVSIAGFDDPSWYVAVRPAITTYVDPLEEMGQLAADLLLRRLAEGDERRRPVHARLSGQLLVRGSTGPPPAGQPRSSP